MIGYRDIGMEELAVRLFVHQDRQQSIEVLVAFIGALFFVSIVLHDLVDIFVILFLQGLPKRVAEERSYFNVSSL